MWLGYFLSIIYCLLLLAFYHRVAAAFDSEIVEAETTNPNPNSSNISPPELPKWNPNDTMLVKPYNILEASCPQGYILANKHCHKRVRGAPTMRKNVLKENLE